MLFKYFKTLVNIKLMDNKQHSVPLQTWKNLNYNGHPGFGLC